VAARKRRQQFVIERGKRREVVWIPWQSASVAAAHGGQTVIEADLLANYLGDSGREVPKGSTLMRIRGTVNYRALLAAQVVQMVTVIVRTREDEVYIEALHTEIVNPVWRDDFNYTFRSLETAAASFSAESVTRTLDSKARRIFENADKLQMISRVILSTGSNDVEVLASGVVLLMLP